MILSEGQTSIYTATIMCNGTTKAGQPCRNRNRGPAEYCHTHMPAPVILNIAESMAVSDAITEVVFPAAEPTKAVPVAIAYADDIAIAAIAEVAETIVAEIISAAIEAAPIAIPVAEPVSLPTNIATMPPQIADDDACIAAFASRKRRVRIAEIAEPMAKPKPLGPYSIKNALSRARGAATTANLKRPARVSLSCTRDGDEVEGLYGHACRVEPGHQFCWFNYADDLLAFNSSMTKFSDVECHELLTCTDARFFIDLDYQPSMRFINATFGSIEQANNAISGLLCDAIREALSRDAKFSISQRSRQTAEDRAKISLHIYTNVAMDLGLLKPFAAKVKEALRRIRDTRDDVAEWFMDDEEFEALLAAFDDAQYHQNGGLAMPGGVKAGHRSTLIRDDGVSGLMTAVGDIRISKRDISELTEADIEAEADAVRDEEEDEQPARTTAPVPGGSFFAEAIAHAALIPGSASFDFRCLTCFSFGMRVARRSGSFCPLCERRHDSDNTLLISVDEDTKLARWTCDKLKPMKWHVWFSTTYVSQADLEAAAIDDKLNTILSALKPERFAYTDGKLGKDAFRVCAILRGLKGVSLASALKTWLAVSEKQLGDAFDGQLQRQAWLNADATKAGQLGMNSLISMLRGDDKALANKLRKQEKGSGSGFELSDDERELNQEILAVIADLIGMSPEDLDAAIHDESHRRTCAWREAHVKPVNHPIRDQYINWKKLMDAVYDYRFETAKEAGKLLAMFIDRCFVCMVNGQAFRRPNLTKDSTERMTPEQTNPFTSMKFHIAELDGKQISAANLMSMLGPLFHEYDKLVVSFEKLLTSTDTSEFNTCVPFAASKVAAVDHSKIAGILDFIKDIICNGDERLNTWILSWMAKMLKFPDTKTKMVPILYSAPEGCGKNTLVDLLIAIIGTASVAVAAGSIDSFVSERREHLIGVKLCVANEIREARNSFGHIFEAFKSLVTDPLMDIRPLYCSKIVIKNLVEMIITTNNLATIPSGNKARRIQIFGLSLARCQDNAYFEGLYRDYINNQDAINHLYTYLTTEIDVDRSPMEMVMTDIQREFCDTTADNRLAFWKHIRDETSHETLSKQAAFQAYKDWCSASNEFVFCDRRFGSFTRSLTDIVREERNASSRWWKILRGGASS